MGKPVIGLDFGNYNSFTCYISDFDANTRMGGLVHDLLPQGLNDGIPSVYFHSKKIGILCGEDAVRSRAKPVCNRVRYLKRHLGEMMTLYDDSKMKLSYMLPYDSAITAVIQHCMRRANEQLQAGYQMTTNLISLSYPATYTFAQRQRLIELAERATLADGTPVKVYGTIAEPAAAALDYLADYSKSTQGTNVLVYDLGGGTFDLALVAAYPGGKKSAAGYTYYYDIINTRGLPKVGGKEFDQIMYDLLAKKFRIPLNPANRMKLENLAETVKIDLSSDTEAEPDLEHNGEFVSVRLTRDEFEQASKSLLQQTINATKEMLRDHPSQKPEFILLTGGASQMPMVKRELESQIPEFRGKIMYFRPSRAIAYGAARFGTSETENPDPRKNTTVVQRRTSYDLGVHFVRSEQDKKGYVSTYIKAGTPIPYTGTWNESFTVFDQQRYSNFHVYEAVKAHPDRAKPAEDYKDIMFVQLDHLREVPKGTKSETRMMIDKLGRLSIEAREKDNTGTKPIKNSIELKNLS